ncbi:periodic tryptophan protein 1 [Spathaspora passalidarum NRRL Y-27907]|uniref:Periodic tryptophan protein 1 n=1 Tax=Spathaspora passalidarum (strain NRRL Y-27907 / 11-Y1) TaxID=619300 RepID=G3AT24_SPAPN|nr:periodic tryptophan protein 1 [Spathaspora passalidarum NRRL Y-27907]EGW30787.1 periodic tryptophan protein 1 [Spathaspora passalidarum NRRL Y-27907]
MISSSTWVPRGFASEFPEKYELNDEEMERITAMANLELSDAKQQLEEAQAEESKPSLQEQIEIDDDLKEYNLESYDDDEVDPNGEPITMFPGLSNTDAKLIQGDEEGEQFLSLPTEVDLQEEKQENQIYPTDNLVLATRTEDDISYLDVYIYDDGAGAPQGSTEEEEDKLDPDVANGLVRDSNLYVHHDIMLPAFPLCVEWINYNPKSEANDHIGNFAAIGTFDPSIEIWNLDYIDKAFPDLILGEPEMNSFTAISKKKSKKKKSAHVTTHHTDAVLSLSHNRIHRSVLASTSADNTVKLWDLNNGTAVRSFNTIHHNKTVSSSQWHPVESQILLTGGYDSTIGLTDVRISDASASTKHYKVSPGEEVENVRWGHTSIPEIFYAGTDNGNIYAYDVRVVDKPLWTLHAHDSGISSLDVNNHIPGMLISSAMGEKSVKLWKCPSTGGPSMILSRDFGLGNVLTTSFAGDIEVAGNLTIGGVSGALKMWDSLSNGSVRNAFKDELKTLQVKAKEEAIKIGRASRIARKYHGDASEDVMTVEAGGLEDDSDSDGEDAQLDMEDEDEE